MMNTFRLRLFGTVQVEHSGQLLSGFKSRKALVLLGYLASHAQPIERSVLVALLWPDKSEARARNNLSQLLHNIQSIWPDAIQAERYTVEFLRTEAHWVDILAFESLVAAGQPDDMARAVALYTGDFMAGVYLDDCPELEQWLAIEQESWRQRVSQTLQQLIDDHVGAGSWEQALEFTNQLLAIDPCQEAAHRQKMQLLASSGQRSAALAHYESCCRVLLAELGIQPEAETIALFEQIKNGTFCLNQETLPHTKSERHPALASALSEAKSDFSFNNLPPQSTSFIGRETELAIIAQRLGEPHCRLLTIVGLGGIGKTRLALQAVANTRAFQHGVCFIPLTAVRTPEFIISTIADTLNFPLYGRGDPKAQLMNYLADKKLLLLMDNFEHLLPGAGILSEILQRAPGVKIVVTSRERLNLQEEWVLDLKGFSYPKSKKEIEIDHYSSVQLFLQRAQQARADFWLSYMDKPAVARICQLVEGLPLGIELAAAWVRTFSCKDIALEIEKNYDFLTTSLQNVPHRHRSLRAAFEHSWNLLSQEEQGVYRQLSVFWGGFNRQSAQDVIGASVHALSALVDKSLLYWNEPDRYEIHELLRQFGAEKLGEDVAERYRAKSEHCRYFAAFLEQQESALRHGRQKEALAAISVEIDNIRAGWTWAVKHRLADEFEKYCEGLFLIYNMQSWFQEGEAVFRYAVASLRPPVATMALPDGTSKRMLGKVLVRQGVFCASLGQFERAREIMAEGLNIFADPDLRRISPLSLTYLGAIAWALGEYNRARQLCQEALEITQATGNRWQEALILQYLGMIAISLGEYVEARSLAQRCLDAFREFGYRSGIAFSLNLYGIAVRNLGKYEEARRVCNESLTIAREIQDRWEEALSLQYLGLIAVSVGEYAAARSLAQQSLAIYRQFDYQSGVVSALNLLATAARSQGDYEEALVVHKEVLATCRQMDYPLGIAVASYHLGRVAYQMSHHEDARQYLNDSLIIAHRLAYQRGVTQSLNTLGHVACAQGKYQEAGQYWYEALRVTCEIQAAPVALDILTGLAQLLAAEGDYKRALELLVFPLNHKASKKETQENAHRLFSELTHQLPPQFIQRAQDRAKTANLEETVAEILQSNSNSYQTLALLN